MNIFKQNGYYSLRYNNSTLAKEYVKSLNRKAIIEGNTSEKIKSYLFLSDIENYTGNYKNAIKYIDTCILYSQKLNKSKILRSAYKVKGSIYTSLGVYETAILYHLKVDSIAKKNNNVLQQIRSNHNIGMIKDEMGKVEEAISIFENNLEILETIPSTHTKNIYINTFISLSSTHIDLNPEKATLYNNKLKEISKKNNDVDALSYYYMFEGKILYNKKQYKKALDSFHVADSITSILGNKRNSYIIHRFQGKCLFEEAKYDEAIAKLEKAKTLRDNKKFQHFEEFEIVSFLAKSYEKKKQKNKALENYRYALELAYKNDSIKTNVSGDILKKYDAKNIEEKIETLTNTAEKEQQNNIILKIIGSILAVILIAFMILYQRSKKVNIKKYEKLLAYINELENKSQNPLVNDKKVTDSKIPDEKRIIILKALEKFEKKNDYLNSKTSLVTVAKKLNTNTSYLSKTINDHKGKSFINYITELRINYALQRIKNDKVFRSYSVKGIAEELGFKTEGSFSRAFKKHTGIYPSYFIKNITANS